MITQNKNVSIVGKSQKQIEAQRGNYVIGNTAGAVFVGLPVAAILGYLFGVPTMIGFIVVIGTGGFAYGAEDEYNEAMDTNPIPSDPIIFDLNGDGLKTTNYVGYFDFDNDGFAELTKWVDNNDAVLVIDSNNNNKIDNGTELVLYSDLLEYDFNQDGIIDSNDEIYSQLKLLKGDGTQLTLQDEGIQSINLDTTAVYYTDENGNVQLSQGTFTREDGSISSFGEFG